MKKIAATGVTAKNNNAPEVLKRCRLCIATKIGNFSQEYHES